ncbi:hypothetical protein BJ684DRAFT_20647 [Piptocephalis cylindrospora]|uniref:Uncharacterized protein n=1 Tax=Piptocephalis cylindrospora TaxID=1907219 RepID=A0A4P9Y1U3_9FUNG|nr:hypothetical protein BJ684DRAFT_20647 [Piptocephalis cylindrospora]|eukprot:RKP12836.1 hypothetical protein BJ684DRAFT_20647 [Piptocephalis cylindrospora]
MTSRPLNIPHPAMGEHMTSQPSPIRSRRGSIQRMEKEADLAVSSASSSCPSSTTASTALSFPISTTSASCYNLLASSTTLMTGDPCDLPNGMTSLGMDPTMGEDLPPPAQTNDTRPSDASRIQDHKHGESQCTEEGHEGPDSQDSDTSPDTEEEEEVMQFSHSLVNDLLKESITEIILHQDLNIIPPALAVPPILTPAWASTSSLPIDRYGGLGGGGEGHGSKSSSRATSPTSRATVSQRLAIKEAIREADARARRYVLDVRPASRNTGNTGTPRPSSETSHAGTPRSTGTPQSPSEAGSIGRPSSEAGSFAGDGPSPIIPSSISPPPSTPPYLFGSGKSPVDPSYWARLLLHLPLRTPLTSHLAHPRRQMLSPVMLLPSPAKYRSWDRLRIAIGFGRERRAR